MIPLRDVIPSRTTPWITLGLLAINALAFICQLLFAAGDTRQLLLTYGLVPVHFSWLNLTTALFLHSGWLHAGSNLLALWLFGDNVEDRMGHGRFLAFYFLAGCGAMLLDAWTHPASSAPIVGASGAVAGVMGAYLVLFPRSRVLVLLPLVVFIDIIEVPALMFLALWAVIQALAGVGRLPDPTDPGGIAFMTQLGGFVAGVVGVWLFKRPERERVEWWGA
jgi:membrane associated rhomboid family serine protease